MTKQASKKRLAKKKFRIGITAHREGKYFCNCLTRNYRKWLGVKLAGHDEPLEEHNESQAENPVDTESCRICLPEPVR